MTSEENDRRAHGPLDARGLVQSSSTIPPYITINEHIYFTADFEDLPEESILVDHVQIGICSFVKSLASGFECVDGKPMRSPGKSQLML